jgi:molecular chaperone DnaK
LGDRVPSGEKLRIEQAISDLRDAINKNDISLIRQRMEALQQESYRLSQRLYEQASQSYAGTSAQAGSSSSGSSSDGEVIDAEFKSD